MALCLAVLAAGCAQNQESAEEAADDIPDEVTAFLEEYLEALKEGPAVSVEYIYFLPENASYYGYYRDSGDPLSDYTLQDSVKVNDTLYAFLITFVMESDIELGKEPVTAWNYVALINGEYRMLNSADNIPEDNQENFNLDDFTVPEGFYTVPEDLLVDEEDILAAAALIS